MEIFKRKWSALSGRRFDAEYYKDEYVNLENLIKTKTDKRLADFILGISSGATPDKSNPAYYTDDKLLGIPFIRVQNLNQNTTISNDFIYITKETHEGMLKRSQVYENDLIVKITGVGRMAISAVAPKNFVGNINQHSVVIKTKDLKISQAIATFLNTDIGEKLASRRATGGTRPALDYQALTSIPIVYNEQFYTLLEQANILSNKKEQEAKELLDSIDKYLLDELGITLPNPQTHLQNRIWTAKFSELSGARFDPSYHQNYYKQLELALENGKYELVRLGDLIKNISYGASVANDYTMDKKSGIPLLRITNIARNEIQAQDIVYLKNIRRDELGNCFVKEGDLLITRSGTLGLVAVISKEYDGFAFGSFMIKFSLNNMTICKNFISYYLNSYFGISYFERNKIGGIQGNITIPIINKIRIPYPPKEIQNQIANEILNRREKAKELQREAKGLLEQAKKQVESMILGE